MELITIRNPWALGDTVCLSALVRDIQIAHPGRYKIHMSGNYSCLWNHNPHCVYSKDVVGKLIKLDYVEGIKASNERGMKIHFLAWFHRDFERATKVKVPVTRPHGDLYLSDGEKQPKFPHRYWVVVAGGKLDMTAKVWSPHRWQETINRLADLGICCVQAGDKAHRHFHPQLRNCENTVGKTKDVRDFLSLIYHSEGVICGVTGAMHIAAAFNKPCVVIAGGREPPWWEAYSNCYSPTAFGPTCQPVKVEHTYLHTIGLLDCGVGNLAKGCWKDRTVPVDRMDHTQKRAREALCRKPLQTVPPLPTCMELIEVDHVVEAVMNYYEKGVLPPVKPKAASGVVLASPPVEIKHDFPPQLRPSSPDPSLALLDHPYIQGRFTVCVLTFGEHVKLAKRCIGSILDSAPPDRIDLRVAANQPSKDMLRYLTGFDKGTITKLYLDHGERRKYPAMREMFHDPACPITTPYVTWFDDDSWVKDKRWLTKLASAIIENHALGVRMYGPKMFHDLKPYQHAGFRPDAWFKKASWWQDKPLFLGGGVREAPNGSQIVFCSGGFWALATETIKAGDIPDKRLNHNGGDATIGAQVHQAGGRFKDFTRAKDIICWSDAPRRGYREPFPWEKYKGQ